MKHPSAYYLLLLYIMVVCKPLIPLLHDVYEHAFNEMEHLATAHHQNGMNHVQYEIGKMEKEDHNTSDNSSKPKSIDDITVHFLAENNINFSNPITVDAKNYFNRQYFLPITYTAIQLPPPKL